MGALAVAELSLVKKRSIADREVAQELLSTMAQELQRDSAIKIERKEGGFTIMELLIVVSIIAILAALITIGVKEGIKAGKTATCANNLHQIGLAHELYIADYDQNFSQEIGVLDIGRPHPGMISSAEYVLIMNTYSKNKEIWFCPFDNYKGFVKKSFLGDMDHTATSYILSIAFKLQPNFMNLASITEPSKTIFLTDIIDEPNETAHGDTGNLLYFAWHVKKFKVGDNICVFPGMNSTCHE